MPDGYEGEWVGVAIPKTHICKLPGTFFRKSMSVWRCYCGKYWILAPDMYGQTWFELKLVDGKYYLDGTEVNIQR